MLRKGKARAQEGQTVSTRSMTTATIGSHSTLNAAFDDHDDESALSFEYVGGTPTDKLSPQHSSDPAGGIFHDDESNNKSSEDDDASDDESTYYEEEESMDDEREWKRDNVLLEMLQEASEDEETEVYEETSRRSSSPSTATSSSSSSSSGYISVDHETNSDDDIIVDVDDDSFLNPPSMYSPRSAVLKHRSGEDMSTKFEANKSVTSNQPTRNRPRHRPPVAVVFEIDDYTSDSGALGEDSLVDFVRDFTEEMKDESTNGSITRSSSQSNGNALTARPSVRVYSTLGARRCDIKTMKQRVLSSETILSTILENRAKQRGNSTVPIEQPGNVAKEDNVSLPSNDSTVEERPYHRRQFSKEMSTEDIVSSMRGEDVLLNTPSIKTKKGAPKHIDEERVPPEMAIRASLTSFASSSTETRSQETNGSNVSGPEKKFTTTLNKETERRRRRLQELRARRQANEQDRQSISLPTTRAPSSSSASVRSNQSSRHQQTPLCPIMQNKPPFRRNESTTTGNTGTSTPTVPTSNLTQCQGLRSHRANSISTQSVSSSRFASLPKKKETSLGRFFSRFSGNRASKKEAPRAQQPRPMTAGAAYRAAVAARGKASTSPAYSSPPKSADQPVHALRAPHSVASTVSGQYYQAPPPAPIVQRYVHGSQRPLASSIQPRRLFDDNSTCTSVWGRCFDDEAASTAKAAAAWV